MAKPIVAEIRQTTKGVVKTLRRSGRIPGVLYGNRMEPLSISVDEKDLREYAGTRGVIPLELNGKTKYVMVKQLQRNPLHHEKVLHVDFMQVAMDETVQTEVPIILTGEAQGVKEGGVLQQPLHMVVVESLPNQIPEQLTYDVSDLQVGDVVTLSSFSLPKGVQLVTDPETVVASIIPPTAETEADDELESVEKQEEEKVE